MIEIPCTLRCDGCKETTSAIAEAEHVSLGPCRGSTQSYAFMINENVLPAGWRVASNGLRCPRCNEIK
jgi:hypothetical protein